MKALALALLACLTGCTFDYSMLVCSRPQGRVAFSAELTERAGGTCGPQQIEPLEWLDGVPVDPEGCAHEHLEGDACRTDGTFTCGSTTLRVDGEFQSNWPTGWGTYEISSEKCSSVYDVVLVQLR